MRKSVSSVLSARRTAYLYVCALLSVLWLFLPYGGYARMMEGKYACYLLLTTGFLAAMAYCLLPDARGGRELGAMDVEAGAYLAFSTLSAICSPYGAQTLLGGTRRDGLLTLALYAATFWVLSRHLRADRRLLYLTALSAALCDVLTLLQLAGYNPFWLYPVGLGYADGDGAYAGYFAGTSGNIDFTAFLLALAVCVLTAAVLRLRMWTFAPVVVLTLWTLYRLGVSSAWVGIVCAVTWGLGLLVPQRRREMLCVSAALSVAALLCLRFYAGGNQTLAEASGLLRGDWNGAFGSGRVVIWRDCWQLVRQRPLLGGGPDTLWLRGIEPFAWVRGGAPIPADITAAHNEYLNILVNQGAAALLAYLALLAGALIACFRRAERAEYAICGMGLLCYAAMACFSISTCITAPYVWVLLALCNRYDRKKNKVEKS